MSPLKELKLRNKISIGLELGQNYKAILARATSRVGFFGEA